VGPTGGGSVLDIRFTLPARRSRVFRALTDSAEVPRWWGPAGFVTSVLKLDPRVGGRLRYEMRPPAGEAFHFAGEFQAVDPPERLVFTFHWEEPDPDDRVTVATLLLYEVGEGTELALTQGEFANESRLELHRNGWIESLSKLRELVESSP
jgi:uncharacterized protein YndB with AHSA1/START domain